MRKCQSCGDLSSYNVGGLCRKCYDKERYMKTRYSKKSTDERKEAYLKEKKNPEKLQQMWRKAKQKYRKNPENHNKDLIRGYSYHQCRIRDTCELCGSGSNLERHHPDYKNPNIQTLCHTCHIQIHNMIRGRR